LTERPADATHNVIQNVLIIAIQRSSVVINLSGAGKNNGSQRIIGRNAITQLREMKRS
jgi:hypothetical protein